MYDQEGNPLTAAAIYSHLKKLADSKETNDQAALIGHLTADERQLWAPIYQQLASSKSCSYVYKIDFLGFSVPENKELFDTINDSVLVLCLDDNYETSIKGTTKKDIQSIAGYNLLHGNGTKSNTANRWFDKTIQVNDFKKFYDD